MSEKKKEEIPKLKPVPMFKRWEQDGTDFIHLIPPKKKETKREK